MVSFYVPVPFGVYNTISLLLHDMIVQFTLFMVVVNVLVLLVLPSNPNGK
jgi:hypothetical protein